MRRFEYQEKQVIGTAHESMRMQFSLDSYPRGWSAVRGQNWTMLFQAVMTFLFRPKFSL
jgi:hypothetical protein